MRRVSGSRPKAWYYAIIFKILGGRFKPNKFVASRRRDREQWQRELGKMAPEEDDGAPSH